MICKGFAVSFDMIDGGAIDAPAAYAMLHDPTGRHWKRTSVLVAPFDRRDEGGEPSSDVRRYLGYDDRAGSVALPPKPLSAWRYEGEVATIWYRRHGAKYGGKRFRHAFNDSAVRRFLHGRGKARLYSRGRLFRLELPRGATADDRGFVWP
jgi:hypothetical protein